MKKYLLPIREPFNAFTHLFGALIAVLGTILLILDSTIDPVSYKISFIIYGITVFLMFGSSALYHSVQVSFKKEEFFRLLDHIMPKMNVIRSASIQSDVATVFSKLNDFNHWSAWSPWLIMEPEAEVTVADDAKYYEWKGNRTGEGNMTITGEQENKQIDYDLTFLKPWKSKAKVSFLLEENGDHTNVTWTMDSSLPFFMEWLKTKV